MADFRTLLKKLQHYFFGKEEEEHQPIETNEVHIHKAVGRMINQEHLQNDFIHQYPKKGKFRFPLEVDEMVPKQETVKQTENINTDFQQRRAAREKFTNRSFKVRNIPSPVYGFHRKEKEEVHEVSPIQHQQEIEEQTQVEQVDEHASPVTKVETNKQMEEKVEKIIEVTRPLQETKNHSQIVRTNIPEPIKVEHNDKNLENKTVERLNSRMERKSLQQAQQQVEQRHFSTEENDASDYQFPPLHLLQLPFIEEEDDSDFLFEQADRLEETLHNFNVSATVVDVTKGPSVTRYEIQPAPGVKVSKITSLIDDIKLALAAKDIRMEAPIPGKHAIGIEVPNLKSQPVFLHEIISHKKFQESTSPLTVALGLDISGQPIITDLKKMPHGLVAGATGSGKSVCINSILISLLYKATPDEVKLMLIDPKVVELAPYNGLPHLISPVITDAKQATAALKWAVNEMERRYELFSQKGVRDISRYNEVHKRENPHDKLALPYIVIIIDELADLMMVSPQDVEDAICRIAQKARACGIHLLLATQRPSVDVITGLIKANIPTRIAFSVSSQVDSRTIIDMSGAERLLGKGDMLFHENGSPKPVRIQGTFVSDEEIEDVIDFVKDQRGPNYEIETEQLVRVQEGVEQDDELFAEACYFVIEQGGASASLLQRRFRIGYNRAARLIDMMESYGIVSEALGSKPRNILMTVEQFEEQVLEMNHQ